MNKLNEVARMQQLAGLTEIKVNKPSIKDKEGNIYIKVNNKEDILSFLKQFKIDNPTISPQPNWMKNTKYYKFPMYINNKDGIVRISDKPSTPSKL